MGGGSLEARFQFFVRLLIAAAAKIYKMNIKYNFAGKRRQNQKKPFHPQCMQCYGFFAFLPLYIISCQEGELK